MLRIELLPYPLEKVLYSDLFRSFFSIATALLYCNHNEMSKIILAKKLKKEKK